MFFNLIINHEIYKLRHAVSKILFILICFLMKADEIEFLYLKSINGYTGKGLESGKRRGFCGLFSHCAFVNQEYEIINLEIFFLFLH